MLPSSSKNLKYLSGKQSLNYNPSCNPTLQLRAPQGWIQQGCVLFWRTNVSFFFQLVWNTLILWKREQYTTTKRGKSTKKGSQDSDTEEKGGNAH